MKPSLYRIAVKSVGLTLKERREKLGLSQRDVATRLGFETAQYVSNVERGVALPPLKSAKKITKIYGFSKKETADLYLLPLQMRIIEAVAGRGKTL